MQQLQVTFVRHNPRQATAKQGPNAGNQFTIHEFFTADDTKFDTTKAEIANAAYALLNQPVLITFEQTQNGQYTNRKLQAVQAADGSGATMAPGVMPLATASAPPAPTAAQAAAPTTGSDNGGTRYADHPDTARRIARSVGLELAIKAAESGVVALGSVESLFDVAHTFGAYVFNGSRPSAATGADSSGAGGGDAGAAPAAPAVAEAAEPVPGVVADDDIPF